VRVAVGADEASAVPLKVVEILRDLGHEVVPFGPLAGGREQWAEVAEMVASAVSRGEAEQGVLLCWTGTGVSIAANKVPGVRAALCTDAETARGARIYNDANVLCMSIRLTSEPLAREILEAWLGENRVDPAEVPNIERVKRADELRLSSGGSGGQPPSQRRRRPPPRRPPRR
jgi:ribose 5-phosphate isomerase B